MSDHILVKDLIVYAYHGVHPEEQRLGQRFEVDLDCEIDLTDAAARDTAAATVSYTRLVEIVQELSAGKKFLLIEALAGTIAETILARYGQIERVTVTVRKPSAPIPATLSHVGVQVSRGRRP